MAYFQFFLLATAYTLICSF